jgi:RES domain-containing protein
VILYRLTKTKYLSTAWTGYGAKEAGGRWNSVGVSMVYVSETASLTMLETLVHLHAAQIMDSFTLLSIDVPDELIQSANMDELPATGLMRMRLRNWLITEMPGHLPGARLHCVFPQPYRR